MVDDLGPHRFRPVKDVDVASLYDGFSVFVLCWLEDFGFCPLGESGEWVADPTASLSVATYRLTPLEANYRVAGPAPRLWPPA